MEYSHLKRGERNRIYEGKCQKKSLGIIAKEVGRHKSTISRETRRNSDKVGYLYPYQADELARKRRCRAGSTKIKRDAELKDFIIEKLKDRLSPKMIAALWRKKYPAKKNLERVDLQICLQQRWPCSGTSKLSGESQEETWHCVYEEKDPH